MPNWKKVLTSGSAGELASLYAPSITGSLQGTASYALSSSFAITASYFSGSISNAIFAETASFITASNVYGPYGSNSIVTASYAFNSVSSSYAQTASIALSSVNASDILIYVKNVTGAQINKGTVVRISGATGDNALIATASYESDNVSANTLGITRENIANDSFGYVITEGTLLGINTDIWSAGQLLFLGANGSITGSAPQAPLHAVRLGQVLRVQQNNGSMYVRIDNGYELNELHDVDDNTTTTSYGDLLVKSGSVWTNSRQLTGSYGLTGSLSFGNGGVTGSLFGTASFANTASFLTSNTNAFIQSGNSFGTTALLGTNDTQNLQFETNGLVRMAVSSSGNVGIGTTTPNAKLDISGSAIITGSLTVTQNITGSGLLITGSTTTDLVRITQTGTGNSFVVEDSTNPDSSPFVINNDGSVGIGTLVPNAKLDVNGNTIITGSLNVTQNITGSRLLLSASTGTNSGSVLTVYGSGSAQPVFTVQGSQGELFSVTDSLSGSLFSVNDISGLPILEVFSDNTTLIGSYQDPMLITTTKLVTTASGAFTIYSLPTASYDTAFFEYSIRSGSNARAGSIMAIQSASAVNFTETTTTDFGSTSGLAFTVLISGANMLLTGSATTSGWTLKTIIRSI